MNLCDILIMQDTAIQKSWIYEFMDEGHGQI